MLVVWLVTIAAVWLVTIVVWLVNIVFEVHVLWQLKSTRDVAY